MTILSNSDIRTWQQCQMRFVFSKTLGLQKAKLDPPLRMGLTGHKILEEASKAAVLGENVNTAMAGVATEVALAGDPESAKVLSNDIAAWTWMMNQGWEVVEAEQPHKIEVEHAYGLTFAFTPDAVMRATTGPMKGQLFVIDYKHTGQYWSDKKIRMFMQIPVYIAYLRKIEKYSSLRHGGIMQINTRKDGAANKRFLFKWVPDINKAKLTRTEFENVEILKEIAQFRLLPVADQLVLANRTRNETVCAYCPFAEDICPMSWAGHDITSTMRHNYVENTYGYEESPDSITPTNIAGEATPQA